MLREATRSIKQSISTQTDPHRAAWRTAVSPALVGGVGNWRSTGWKLEGAGVGGDQCSRRLPAGWVGTAAEPGVAPQLLRAVPPGLSGPKSEPSSQTYHGAARPRPIPPTKLVFLPRYLPAPEPAILSGLGHFSKKGGGQSRRCSLRPRSRLPCPLLRCRGRGCEVRPG